MAFHEPLPICANRVAPHFNAPVTRITVSLFLMNPAPMSRSSVVDLKFLSWLRRARQELQIRNPHHNHDLASVLTEPEVRPEQAAQ